MKLVLIQPSFSGEPMHAIREVLAEVGDRISSPDDLVLLPEHVRGFGPRAPYLADVRAVAAELGCHVVGGSFHEDREGGAVNAGVVVAPNGDIVGEYEKLRPYARERTRVEAGDVLGEITVGGRRILVLICADFWFVDLFFAAEHLPDVVLVPAFSVTRKPTPDYSRALWRHLAVARAYELGLYVGISDWAAPAEAGTGFPTSGVSGFANPTTEDPARFFTPVQDESFAVFELDWDALDAFRKDRMDRGFYWKEPG